MDDCSDTLLLTNGTRILAFEISNELHYLIRMFEDIDIDDINSFLVYFVIFSKLIFGIAFHSAVYKL